MFGAVKRSFVKCASHECRDKASLKPSTCVKAKGRMLDSVPETGTGGGRGSVGGPPGSGPLKERCTISPHSRAGQRHAVSRNAFKHGFAREPLSFMNWRKL